MVPNDTSASRYDIANVGAGSEARARLRCLSGPTSLKEWDKPLRTTYRVHPPDKRLLVVDLVPGFHFLLLSRVYLTYLACFRMEYKVFDYS